MIPKIKLELEESLDYWNLCDQIGQDKRKNLKKWADEHKIKYDFRTIGIDEVCIYYFPDKIVVAVDGSDKDRKEWEGNFSPYGGIKNFFKSFKKKYRKVDSENGYHRDYFIAAQKIIKWVFETIGDDDRDIAWVGHSRGAAIALLAYLLGGDYLTDLCVPFACPRSIMRWRVKYMKKHKADYNVQTYFIKGDIVDNVPPFILGWQHFYNYKTKLPRVRGLNHIEIGKAIEKAIRKRDGKRKSTK